MRVFSYCFVAIYKSYVKIILVDIKNGYYMELIIITKKEKAAAHLMKESILQIKDYIEENKEDSDLKEEQGAFSLIFFMAEISMSWMISTVGKIDTALSTGKVWLEAEEVVRIKSLVDFYKESSGDLFFASNLFDIAYDLLTEPEESDLDDVVCVRNID